MAIGIRRVLIISSSCPVSRHTRIAVGEIASRDIVCVGLVEYLHKLSCDNQGLIQDPFMTIDVGVLWINSG